MPKKTLRLGINIDHVATLRQVRLGIEPRPEEAAKEAVRGGADQITIHLREDRRHIQDRDLASVQKAVRVPVNLEMALNDSIIRIALRHRPEKVCIVPEKRRELTTEGGLDVVRNSRKLYRTIPKMKKAGIQVSLFIGPVDRQVRKAAELGADAIEIHTGAYAEAGGAKRRQELTRIRRASVLAAGLGLKVHAGHGLDLNNVNAICRIPHVEELNIGHSVVAHAVFTGLRRAVREMKNKMRQSIRS